MVKRLLSALDYPNADKINVNGTSNSQRSLFSISVTSFFQDENHLRRVIVWLEETKLKKYNNLQQLKNVNHPEWPNYLESYKKAVGCPAFANRTEEVQWLLGYVIQQEYSGKSNDYNAFSFAHIFLCFLLHPENSYNQHAVEHIKSVNVPNVVAENPLDKLDCKVFKKQFAPKSCKIRKFCSSQQRIYRRH